MFLSALGYTIVFVVVVLWLLHVYLKRKPAYLVATQLPGPPIYPIIGNLTTLMFMNGEQTFKFLRDSAILEPNGGRIWTFGMLHVSFIRAWQLETLLTSTKYITKSQMYTFLHSFLGTGLLTSTGQKWFHRRRILTPAFHFNILQDFLLIFREESHRLVKLLMGKECRHGMELQKIVPRFTLNTICETAMGVQLESTAEPDTYRRNILKIGKWLLYRSVNFWLHGDFFYKISGLERILNKYVNACHEFSWSVIDRRRAAFREQAQTKTSGQNCDENLYFGGKKKRSAMLDTLLAAEGDGLGIDEHGIREEVDTFMFEGYDTTSAAVLFTLFMLAHHRHWQTLAHDEIKQILGERSEEDLVIPDYNEMNVLNRIIKETLRMYPPVPFIGRQLQEPLKMGDVELPVGTQIYIQVFDLHRDPEQFPDPNKFDPDRFLPENARELHHLAYIPFSAGPRNCIGQKFAMLEIQTLVTNILLKYDLVPITKIEDVIFISDLVLRTKTPVRIKFNHRYDQSGNIDNTQ